VAAHTDNSVVINAPREFVWERMMDIESWPNLFSEYAKAEVLEQEGDTVQFRLTTHPDPEYDGKVWSWTSERTADPASYSSKSRRIETGPFEYMTIEWYFEEEGEGTKMRWVQDFSMKPDAPADDATAEDYMNKNTKEQMGIIKEKLEKKASEQA
jgi:aromatase